MCKNVLNLSHATSQNMPKYGSNTICDACNNDPLFCEILDIGCERYEIFSDFVTTASNKSLKNRFWKEKPVENVFTVEGLPFNSSMILFHT